MTYKEYENPEELRKLQLVSTDILEEFDRVCKVLDIPYFIYAGTAIGAVRHQGFIPWDDDIDVGLLREDYNRFLAEAPAVVGDRFEVVSSYTERYFPACNANLSLKGTLGVPEEFDDCPYQYAIGIGIFAFDKLVDDPKRYKRQSRRTWMWGRLAFLRATPTPHLSLRGWKRGLVLAACRIAYSVMKVANVSPQWIYRKWEQAATLYNGTDGVCVADFMDKDPKSCSARLDELFPTKTVAFEGLAVQTARDDDAMLRRIYGDYLKLPPVEDRWNHLPSKLDFGSY
ncbi:LicD family protein [Raoultibacter phocaeensis]|uniref:LicD family protein n=1 Tax=Raoultibacter phocaeensis TaxID=2479841 RepID=UPI00111A7A1C|nr:LicD family protein [Raoultibacter phocaeensis]